MQRKILQLVLVAIVASLGGLAFDCKKEGVKGSDPTIYSAQVILDKYDRGNTTKGVNVHSFNNVGVGTKQSIDTGLQTTFDIAAAEYPDRPFKRHDGYFAGVFWKSSKCQSSSFTVQLGVSPYDNDGVFDKDPRPGHTLLCVAGAFHFVENKPAVMVVYEPANAAATIIAAQYEAEHAVLTEVDPNRFIATAYHTNGTGHPIFTQPGAEKAAPTTTVTVQIKSDGSVVILDPEKVRLSPDAAIIEIEAWKRGERACLVLTR